MTDTDDSTIRPVWVVLRRSQHPRTLDNVSVAYRSDSRDDATEWLQTARNVQEEIALYPDIYELAEC